VLGRPLMAKALGFAFDIDMQLKIVAAILERPVIQKILDDLGLDHRSPIAHIRVSLEIKARNRAL
jgi:hypothetical protein